MCELCMVENRGPLGTIDVRTEDRMNEAGIKETRNVADVYWDDVGDCGGTLVPLHSDCASRARSNDREQQRSLSAFRRRNRGTDSRAHRRNGVHAVVREYPQVTGPTARPTCVRARARALQSRVRSL